MGCAACKVAASHSKDAVVTPAEYPVINESDAPHDNAQASPGVALAASVPSTAASPHHGKNENVKTGNTKNDNITTDKVTVTAAVQPDGEKPSGLATLMKAAASPTAKSLQVTPDPSATGEISPKALLGSKDKAGLQRDLSSCRLKRSVEITEVYEISTTQVLGTGNKFLE